MNYDMLMMDSWITRRRGGRAWKQKKTVDEGEEEVNKRKILALVMWYLLLINLLKRMLSSARDAKLMIWHAAPNGHKKDGKLQHPANTRQWKTFDLNHPEFFNDPRNVRFALSTNGMNPFGEMTNSHSTWPQEKVSYVDYPCFWFETSWHWYRCILEPFMEDMQKLWGEGVHVWDV
jgi:hypothetical protein